MNPVAPAGTLAAAIAARYRDVEERVRAAAARAGRDPASVRVVAVSKRHPAATVAAAWRAGVRDLAENYVQELVAKRQEVGALPGLRWHFIGRLQRNKVKQLAGTCALLHCVDSSALLAEIGARAAAAGLVQPLLLAVNVAGEAHKSGVSPAELPVLLSQARTLPAVRVDGLMTMPPLAEEPAASRPYFRALRALRDALATAEVPLSELSIGTTGDFEVAVEEGATLVRIGTAIFGERPG